MYTDDKPYHVREWLELSQTAWSHALNGENGGTLRWMVRFSSTSLGQSACVWKEP